MRHYVKNIILASGSPRRRELLQQIGISFTVITSNADEITTKEAPQDIVMELSSLKAKAVYNSLSEDKKENSIVIGADTIVYHNKCILGKPQSKEEVKAMIKSISGCEHSVYTGVTFIGNGIYQSFYEKTNVLCYDMSDREIEQYIATGDCMDKAGGYGIQGAFAAYVKGIEGDYNNVVGLPAARLYQEIKTFL